jgi:N,N'-diacetylchitobiose phosphorylase
VTVDRFELSNGRYRVELTGAVGGYSAWEDTALTRRVGSGGSAAGVQLLIRDEDHDECWRAGEPGRHGGVVCRLEVAVAPDRDLEIRRVTLKNQSRQPRRLQITSYVEVALNDPAADAGHPAFSKLFVQTERVAPATLLAFRRPRSPDEPRRWMGHSLWHGSEPLVPEYETDRARFIGRGRSLEDPAALDGEGALTGATGNVLDPVLCLRYRVTLRYRETVRIVALISGGRSREDVLALLAREQALRADEIFQGARTLVLPPDASVEPEVRIFQPARPSPGAGSARIREDLRCWNGYGGFSADGNEYVISLARNESGVRLPPLPWVNVVANEAAGFITSELGAGYTWSVNSRENRLTPWHNDPVSDPCGEALYLRDEDRLVYWSPLPGPVPGAGDYEVRHGFGYTRWTHTSQELEQEVLAFVPREDPVKVSLIRIVNRSTSARRLSLFAYLEWVLGVNRADTMESIVTARDRETGALIAEHPARGEFSERVAFLHLAPPPGGTTQFTCDREDFLGESSPLSAPSAIVGERAMSGAAGKGYDPCAAIRVSFALAAGEALDLVVLTGEAASRREVADLVTRYRDPAGAHQAWSEVAAFWREVVTRLQVQTPVPAIDLLVNGWLTYQNLSCRIWARSAFYQSGGAYGFRDQLQDAAALIYSLPSLTRSQILLHAAHQFSEGDVLHWWHPPLSKGIRTRFSDDLLWLPFVTSGYLAHTGDAAILDELIPFVSGRPLEPGEDEAFLYPERGDQTTTLYDHSCRAIDRSLTRGRHGLPLMGTGDWNDGMNRVGREGKGESVWLGFFLYRILEDFIPWCERRGDGERANRYRRYQADLAEALNDGGWDGAWYRRAYYDDGTPLGSKSSDECRIDAIAQAWAVLSGAAPAQRAAMALDAAEQYLVDEPAGIIRLLTPPFDRTPHDPGYIKGYLPGVRENGGQYTHGALWLVRALAEACRDDRAARLLAMLSPITRSADEAAVGVYQVEPYVIAADVYGAEPYVGRGGWTWYTGSAGWFFRVAVESVLGMTIEGGREMVLRPRIPPEWPGYTIRYRLPESDTLYEVRVVQAQPRPSQSTATLDGRTAAVGDGAVRIPLQHDGISHEVWIQLGSDLLKRPAVCD